MNDFNQGNTVLELTTKINAKVFLRECRLAIKHTGEEVLVTLAGKIHLGFGHSSSPATERIYRNGRYIKSVPVTISVKEQKFVLSRAEAGGKSALGQ